ncbi:MAG: lysylphosphatidylglycerol synthase transmembrane domain-containing protein [Candidatus Caldatribacteriota bacterium]|nr:lysylphosphatidylglycerol synthase transmembrane domain-containing protein [Atribacterota bacterium]
MDKDILSKKKIIRGLIISLTIGVAVFLLVFLLTIDKNTLKSFQQMDIEYIFLAASIIFIAFLVEGLRIKVVASAIDEKIDFWESVKIYYISYFLGGITPYFSGAVPSQIALFVKNDIPIGKATMIATIRPIIKSIIFFIATPVLFFYFKDSLDEYEVLSWVLLVGAMFFSSIFVLIFILIVNNPQKINTIIEWLNKVSFFNKYLSKPGIEKKVKWLKKQASQFNKSFHLLLGHPKEMILSILYTVIYWLLFFLIAPILLLAMGIELDFVLVIVIQVLIFFVIPFLPTPGGSGAAEVGFVSLFSFFVPEHLLGIYVGGWRLFTFYINIFIGAILSLVELKKWANQENALKPGNKKRSED